MCKGLVARDGSPALLIRIKLLMKTDECGCSCFTAPESWDLFQVVGKGINYAQFPIDVKPVCENVCACWTM